jgi:transcriptional regulator
MDQYKIESVARKRAIEIARMRESGFTCREIGEKLGISGGRVSSLSRKGWRLLNSIDLLDH